MLTFEILVFSWSNLWTLVNFSEGLYFFLFVDNEPAEVLEKGGHELRSDCRRVSHIWALVYLQQPEFLGVVCYDIKTKETNRVIVPQYGFPGGKKGLHNDLLYLREEFPVPVIFLINLISFVR